MKQPKPTGHVVYSGPSAINGKPIVAILTTESKNPKTGNMAQLWIMPADMAPHEALKAGADEAVCGNCKHRRSMGGACYVTVHQGPLSVWKAWQRGNYPYAGGLESLGYGLDIRLGAYGDPAALPQWVITELLQDAAGWTGYTHQWNAPWADYSWLKPFVMASADTEAEAEAARAAGWRYFRIRTESESIGQREFMCPASDEGGNRTDCKACQACNGAGSGSQKASPVIIVHGSMASRFLKLAA